MRSLVLLVVLVTACGNTELLISGLEPEADAGSGSGSAGGGSGGGGGGTGGGLAGGSGGGAMPVCNASNCSGCCALGVCHPGNVATACGARGGACATCLTGLVCRTDFTCGMNGVDPSSMWIIQPIAATIDDTVDWDALSDPDPEVALWCPATEDDVSAYADKVADTFSPTWSSMTGDCRMTAAALKAVGVGFDVADIDLTDYEVIAPYTEVKATEADFAAGQMTIGTVGGLKSMTLRLTRQ